MKIFENKIVTLIVLPVITLVIGSLIYDWVKEVPLFTLIADVVKTIWYGLIWFLNIELRLWWVIIFLMMLSFIIYLIIKMGKTDMKNAFPYRNYTSDMINGIYWTWKWNLTPDEVTLTNLKANCPRDKTPLIEANLYARHSHECPRCGSLYYDVDSNKVGVIIADNANKGIYTKNDLI
ncbi:hypothetical protein JGH11_03535 [Dysgonomonas sp. Marseille-P4677]|uniref:hypothetical protein n=1 Tax=Dysgonomonas sp. Marseille-P4677 TaxID=2364790 RepID=UPI00191498D0|nr:hypothetical protein [Dysgonomonas sp. Marseille-P4677]MBK5719936.1 hypothetical protein [Dysgonomonas sp. Marseille-P4677]